jgi:sugar phosphate isomerase/epimerase
VKLGIAIASDRTASGPYMLSGDLLKGIHLARSLGYAGVELSLRDSAAIDRGRIEATLQRDGMRAFAIATGLSADLDGLSLLAETPEYRDGALARLRSHIDFARTLGCPVILGGVRGSITACGERYREVEAAGITAIARCLAYAEHTGVAMLLEPINRYETNLVNSLADARELLQYLGATGVKLLLDTYHMNIEEPSIEGSILAAGPSLGYLHVADSNRRAPGWGHINFASVLGALQGLQPPVDVTVEALPLPDGRACAVQAMTHLSAVARALTAKDEAPGKE